MNHIYKEFLLVANLLSKEGLTYAHTGNMSRKLGEELFITRRGAHIGHLFPEDIINVPLTGRSVLDERASSELNVHRKIIKTIKADALLHTHSPCTVSLSLEARTITPKDTEGKAILGSVPVVSPSEPSASEELADCLIDAFKRAKVAVVRGHGVFALGENLLDAYKLVSLLEHSCKILRRCE
ncbi:MAG: aldolase [Aquificae bacterium]|nr:aldolase [Aquificota bacterium]